MKSEKPSPDALLDNGNNQNKTILFPNGIPGFEDLKTFRLLKEPLNPSVFILQSVEKPDLNIRSFFRTHSASVMILSFLMKKHP